jgi:uncharacterized protein (TIGR00251 family)
LKFGAYLVFGVWDLVFTVMSLPSYLKVQGDVVYLHAKVQPRASQNAIGAVLGNELKIKVTAPPVDSAANEALVKFLAELLECSRGAVQIVRGETSRHKVLAIRGMSAEFVQHKLGSSTPG